MQLPSVPVPQDVLLSPEKVADVLSQDAVSARIMAEGGFPSPGDLVGVRCLGHGLPFRSANRPVINHQIMPVPRNCEPARLPPEFTRHLAARANTGAGL